MVRAQEDDAQRRVDGEQRKVQLKRDHVEDGERCPVGKGEPTERVRGSHSPNPRRLFTTCPMRKPHQTIKARIAVKMARERTESSARGRRQLTQYAGSSANPI